MVNSAKQIGATAVLGLAVCAFTGAQVRGQNRPRQIGQGMTLPSSQSNLALTGSLQQALLATTLGLNPYAGFGNFAGLGSAYAGGANPYASLSSNPYGGAGLYGGSSGAGQYSSSYGNPYSGLYQDPNGAYLEGGANVINAQSRFLVANTFLRHFDEALHALGRPDVGNHFTGKYALKAETVAELVQQMVDKGLQFAPALPGDETAYSALHQALATYDRAAQP